MAAYFDIRGTATKILTASIATLTITTLLAIAYGVKVAGNLIPSTDDAYTVGTSTGPFRWSEGHFSDDILVGGSSVCLESGVNCPASSGSSTDTLAIVTARGASATSTLQLYGGFLASSSTVTSTFYVVGDTTLTNATTTGLFATSFKATSGTLTTLAGTNLFGETVSLGNVTSVSLFSASLKATSGTVTTLAAGTFFYGNATGTNLFATVVSSTNLFATTAIFATTTVAGKGVCLSDGSFCAAAAPGGLSGGIAGSVAVWGSASTLGATSTLTYSTTTGILVVQEGRVSSTLFEASGHGKGSCAEPFFTFSDDTDTGLAPVGGANSFSMCGAGSEVFRASSAGNLSFQDLRPNTNNTRSLGTQATAWMGFHVSSTSFFGGALLPRIGAIPDIGSTTSAWGTVYFTSATGSLANLFNLNVSGTVDVASGTKMTYGGNNVRKTIVLRALGATVPFSNAAATATQTEGSTNRVNYFASSFQPSAWNTLQWTDIKAPNDYDGGTFDCKFVVTATSTPTFTGVTWTIRGVAIGSGDAIDTAWGTTATKTIVNSFAANTELITSSTVMTMSNTPTRAKSWYFEASRDVANASDTNTTTQRLKEVVCTYGVDKWSSAF